MQLFRSLLLLAFSLLLLSACVAKDGVKPSVATSVSLPTIYDYQLLDHNYQPVTLAEVAQSLSSADVVFIGEYHRNQASHLLEMQMFAALHALKKGRPMILSMEMFERQQQQLVDDYLDGFIGERYLINEAPAWKNYQGSYRPLVEYAKQNEIPVVAANASGDIVRCIGRKGRDYLDKLDAEELKHIAQQPFAEVEGYDKKFFDFMARGKKKQPTDRQRQSFLAQLTRDNTMAESIFKALKVSPGSQVVHLNGSFHSAEHLGTVGALKRLNPKLKLKVITPVHRDKFDELKKDGKLKDDFYYLLNPQPDEFVEGVYKKKIRKEMFDKAREKAKNCK